MKFSLILVAFAAVACTVYGEVSIEKRSIQCDSILATKVCDNFRDIAAKLKLKATAIQEQIQDAYSKGITNAEEVKANIEKFLQEKILSRNCEDFVDKSFCDKLDTIGVYLQKKGEDLKIYIAKAMLDGAALAKDIKQKVENYVRDDLMKKKCVDILPVDKCQQIKDIGNALKLKAEQIKNATIEGIIKGYKKVQDTVTVTLNTMKQYAENFTCEELLNPNICISLRKYARKIRVGVPKIMGAVRTVIVMGYKVGKGFLSIVYKIADAFIDCEHFLSQENCEKIKETARKIGATATKVKDAIAEAVKKGITEAEKIYKSALDYLKNKFGRKRRSLVEKRDLKATLEKYREMLKTGIRKAQEYLKKSIAKVMDALKIADAKIREAVEKAITEGKTKYEDVKKFIEDLLAKKSAGSISKRAVPSLRDLLKSALSKATGIVKLTIEKLLTLTNTQLQKMKRYVQGIIDFVIGETKRDLEDEMFNDASNSMAEENLRKVSNDFSEDIDDLMNEIAEDAAGVIHEVTAKKMHKRFLDVDLSDLQLKDIVESILKNHVGKVYEKLASKSQELVRSIKEALKTAGSSMIDVSKVVLAKINEMVEQLTSGPEF